MRALTSLAPVLRRRFQVGISTLLVSGYCFAAVAAPNEAKSPLRGTVPQIVESDGKLEFAFGPATEVLPRGLQPSILRTATGALVVQAQVPEKSFPSKRMVYPYALETVISRDQGRTWTKLPLPPGVNGLNMEGGVVQLRNGTILALDTYITPADKPDAGVGQVYTSTNDWRTLEGPVDVSFVLPGAEFYASKDDGGHPHDAQRLHRRILELPNGSLLTTYYGWLKGDNAPSTYMPSMKKSRTVLTRSDDGGRNWRLVSTVAVDPAMGTEGFGEPVIARLSKRPHPGRLICLMRTGRELREAVSDDEGVTWTPSYARVFAGRDIYRTDLWVDMFRNIKGRNGRMLDENNLDELPGAVVDPDLIELRSGLLVAAFGVRITQKACWHKPEHPWNGNYLAFSADHGKSWSNVVQLTSGVMTTHYMAVEETLTPNKIFVAYDLGSWNKVLQRGIYARFVDIKPTAK